MEISKLSTQNLSYQNILHSMDGRPEGKLTTGRGDRNGDVVVVAVVLALGRPGAVTVGARRRRRRRGRRPILGGRKVVQLEEAAVGGRNADLQRRLKENGYGLNIYIPWVWLWIHSNHIALEQGVGQEKISADHE